MKINIAIDGPAGAGKSSIAKEISRQFGFVYVDTGAMYRAIGLYMLRKGINPKEAEKVLPLLSEIKLSLRFSKEGQRVLLNGEDVSEEIREPQVSMAASDVSAIPGVRDFLLNLQQEMAKQNDVIMDGRDIGTVVLPNAQLKIYLTASAEERAQRRRAQLQEKGIEDSFETVLEDIRRRDYQDSHRKVAPLKSAADAQYFDTTGNTLEESVQMLSNIIKKHFNL
ncbi:cytidylate kinase [Ruminococcaceae bacterium BL-4]|nr:cytidylate kinase [Ruminococcaceae bacterium BL-4]